MVRTLSLQIWLASSDYLNYFLIIVLTIESLLKYSVLLLLFSNPRNKSNIQDRPFPSNKYSTEIDLHSQLNRSVELGHFLS